MRRLSRWAVAGVVVAGAGIIGGSVALAAGGDDGEAPITGDALEKATAAALAHTGGGQVTDTEVGDEEGRYEVEVRLPDGRQVDVHLDENFAVISTVADDPDDSEDSGD